MTFGWPLPKRRAYLEQLSKQSTDKTYPVRFQGKLEYFPIRVVPIDLSLYRLENGRTVGRQREYLSQQKELPADFFRADTERADAQAAQHKILKTLASESKNLFRAFRDQAQEEPLILSHLGYVINGNRRLATWRQMIIDEEDAGRFKNIEVVVLPFADEKAIDQLEADLQLKEDLKADYDWTGTALMFREKMDQLGYKESEILSTYDYSRKELRELLDILDYGEQYLGSRGRPNKYSDVDKKEFGFRALSRCRSKFKKAPAKKEALEDIAFCLIDEADEGAGRVYSEIPKIADHLDVVVDTVAGELEIGGTDGADRLAKIAQPLKDPANFATVRAAAREALASIDSRNRQKKKADFVANQIAKARTCLEDAQLAQDKRSTRDGVKAHLQRIKEIADELERWASEQ